LYITDSPEGEVFYEEEYAGYKKHGHAAGIHDR
jgi:hypothetical protein